jgi:hypothetical protein
MNTNGRMPYVARSLADGAVRNPVEVRQRCRAPRFARGGPPKRTSELNIRDSILVLKCPCAGFDIPGETSITNKESSLVTFFSVRPISKGTSSVNEDALSPSLAVARHLPGICQAIAWQLLGIQQVADPPRAELQGGGSGVTESGPCPICFTHTAGHRWDSTGPPSGLDKIQRKSRSQWRSRRTGRSRRP